MIGIQGYVDERGLFFANIISKNGRNEIQIYPINKDEEAESVVVENSVMKLELEIDEGVRVACWISYDVLKEKSEVRKRGRKRTNEDQEQEEESIDSTYLAVATTKGEILVISPREGRIVNKISHDMELINMCSSLKNKSVWGLSTQSTLLEFSLDTNKITKKYKLDEKTDYKCIEAIRNKSAPSSKSQHLMLASNVIEVIDPFKTRKASVLHTFDQFKNNSLINMVKQSLLVDKYIYFTKEGDCDTYLFDTEESKVRRVLKTKEPIQDFQLLIYGDEELVYVRSGGEINVFTVSQDEETPLACLRVYDQSDANSISLSNVFIAKSSQLVGVWYDENSPRFAEIKWDFRSKGEIRVECDYIKKNHVPSNFPESNIKVPDSAEIDNLPGFELFQKCQSLLSVPSDKIDRNEVLKLCSSNDDEENIKGAVMSISSASDTSSTMSSNLFTIISMEIAENPTKSSSLSLWLKWLLLICGGHLARQTEHHNSWRSLYEGLNNGQKLMPRLLALQGKFQLLRSQAELRDKLSNLEMGDDSYEQVFNNEDEEEEDIVYVNGEYDDFDQSKADFTGTDPKNSIQEKVDDRFDD